MEGDLNLPNPRYLPLIQLVAGIALVCSLPACGGGSKTSITPPPPPPQGGIQSSFFGIHINRLSAPWPFGNLIAVGGQRLLDSQVNWAEIETTPGNYNFTKLDQWVSQAQAHGADLVYSFVDVPQFYSSNPTDTTCAYPQNGNGGCDPPTGLNSDGTGSDTAFMNFVTALATHVGSKIKYWEMWNEPDIARTWTGTPKQLVRMAQDATCIIKATGPGCTATPINANAQMLTPAPAGGPNFVQQWMQQYLAAGGGQFADVISFHGYVLCVNGCPPPPPSPEFITTIISNLQSVLVSNGQQQKPIFDSEGSWGNTDTNGFNDQDLRAGFAARFLVLQQSAGIARVFWYRWDFGGGGGNGTLWDVVNTDVQGCNGTGVPFAGGFLCQAGMAYQQVYTWLVGATLSTPCAASGTVWTCGYTRANGYQAQIVWDTSQSCSGGVCTTSSYTPASQYKQYRDLAGNTTAITNGTVAIGAKPVIIEN